ncbi:MAG: hypothetical protein K0U93_23535 [Gammaproteobacteria bacterium]|nr:hypothetical protein [Gammaproteobacteria bacterium]
MDTKLLDEVLECLSKERTRFPYFKDRYAFLLLADCAQEGAAVSDLKRSRFAGLLNKPSVKAHLATCGGGSVAKSDLTYAWQEPSVTFLLTAGQWIGEDISQWSQVSRPGANLVLRLHCPASVDRLLWKQLAPEDDAFFGAWCHPILGRGERRYYRETLAWSRIDFDFHSGEALIEELQTDWVREVGDFARHVARATSRETFEYYGVRINVGRAKRYLNALAPYAALWEEAMLMATIQFIRDELGLDHIYMHDWESGNRLKRITHSYPPRRLYTSLPKRFCFDKTAQSPDFLLSDRRFVRHVKKLACAPSWHRLAA